MLFLKTMKCYDQFTNLFQPKNRPWSKKRELKERKELKKTQKELKRKRKHDSLDNAELDDLANDAKLIKKLKKGKV